ncbi:MAG TPA: hypothetical protein VK639_17650, partial [Terriglobales bacterium]|nr:hypothetical protein [Terriglobales bacterium]
MKISLEIETILGNAAAQLAYRNVAGFAACLFMLAGVPTLRAGTMAEWKGGGGTWENAAMWGGTLPSRTTAARVDGTTEHPSDAILAHAAVL